VIRGERGPGRHQVADQVRATEARRDLDGARQRHDVRRDGVLAEEAPEHVRVGGRDAPARDALQAFVPEVLRHGECEPAPPVIELLQHLDPWRRAARRHREALLLEHVHADEAQVADVLLHQVRDVVVADEQHVERHVLAVTHQLVLAAVELESAAVQQVERLVGQPARFLHGDAQPFLPVHQRSPSRRAARA
jgi:hypothetical protein